MRGRKIEGDRNSSPEGVGVVEERRREKAVCAWS